MAKRGSNFKRVKVLHPPRSLFDLSYEKKFTCDMGQLIPVLCDEVVPGDFWQIGNQCIVRMQPLVAPVLHEINVYTHYYFVPYRLLWPYTDGDDPGWEVFITGGDDGDDDSTIPTWEPVDTTLGSLWDFMGFPIGVDPDGAYPVDFPRRAYNMVWNEFYRDENLQTKVSLAGEDILLRNWEKDYFTSAQTDLQKGTAPALPIAGTANAVWPAVSAANAHTMQADSVAFAPFDATVKSTLENNTIDLSVATTVDISDLRLAFQIQAWLERNQRAGSRYTEFLLSHFGVAPRDERLDRPEYIGGTKSNVIVSEVLQTSQTDTTPQGTLAGHGLNFGNGYAGKYHVQEFGLIIGFMSIMPKPVYDAQGINKQWLKETRYDYFFPEFVGLSEQPIIRAEIYADGVPANNQTIFGYQGRYDEMRVKNNMVCSDMTGSGDYDYWHISRQFAAAPSLNSDFIECEPRKDIFAAPSEPGFIVSFANLLRAFRPIPVIAEPGKITNYGG